MKFKNTNKKGFTLIELMLVIAIIGILVVIVVIAINPVKLLNDAKDSKHRSNLNAIKAALQLYYNDCKTYPPASIMNSDLHNTSSPQPMGTTTDSNGFDDDTPVVTTCDNNQQYMKQIPADAGYNYTLVDSQDYYITADLNTTQATRKADDTNTLTKCGAATNSDSIDFAVCNE